MQTKYNKTIKEVKRQQGMTAISIMALLVIAGVIVLLGLRLFPIYMEHFKAHAHLEELSHEAGIAEKSDAEIIKAYFNRLQIDDVNNVKRDNFFIEHRDDGTLVLAVEYEVRTHALGNIDMVVSFVDEVQAH